MPIRPVDPNRRLKAAAPAAPKPDAPMPRKRRRLDSAAEPQPVDSPSQEPPLDPNRNPDGSYKVGKNQTPEDSRWKPGQSGNPRGRKKMKADLDEIIIDMMEETITLTSSQGRKLRMTQVTALMRKLYEKAIKGDLKTAKDLIDRYAEAKGRQLAAGSSNDGLNGAEKELLEFFLRRFRGGDDDSEVVGA